MGKQRDSRETEILSGQMKELRKQSLIRQRENKPEQKKTQQKSSSLASTVLAPAVR